jgi:hypothetical protein
MASMPVPCGECGDRRGPGLEVAERWRAASTFVIIGSVCVVAGGLVAAVSGPTDFERGSWLAAYLVLVGGVAQIALGAGQAWVARCVPTARATRIEAWSWNAGVVAVVAGTLSSLPILTSAGGVASAVALGLFVVCTGDARRVRRGVRIAYRSVAAAVLLGTLVGLALAWLRHG